MTDKAYLISIGSKIKAEREKRGMRMRDFTPLCKLHVSNLCAIELGKVAPNILTLKRIANALDKDIKDFL